ncbi:acyl-CoA dehydrogenase family protein [Chloroflexota bacterium]
MDFRFSDEEEAFRKEILDFVRESLPSDWPGATDVMHEEAFDELHHFGDEMRREMAARGWIGISWPEEYGGQGAPLAKQVVLEEECTYRTMPGYDQYSMVLAGPLILKFGTEEQKRRFIPPITRGVEKWSIGMSEPNAGSDLASLETRAVEQEDCFVLSGQKTWQSGTHYADWSMVYARTDPDAPKHRGLSCLLVNLKSPGITMRRIALMSGIDYLNDVFYDNVKVPKENLLGSKHGGWKVATASLSSERTFGLLLINEARQDLEQLVQYCKETYINGQPLAKDPIIRNRLGQTAIEIEVGRAFGCKLSWLASKGIPIIAEGSQTRLYGVAVSLRLANLGMQILGLPGQLGAVGGNWRPEDKIHDKWCKLKGRMKNRYLNSASVGIWSGTTEVSKNTVAAVMGLPQV